jgi:ABC-type oligopeptide transport system substrate-binding subunit
MVLNYWQNTLSPGTEQMRDWGCDAAKQKGRFNYAGICDPKIDKLAAAIAAAPTYDDLVTRARALDRALIAGFYMIPLYYAGADFVAYRANVHHPATIPVYGMVLESWWEQ